jgi:hypothetical protein
MSLYRDVDWDAGHDSQTGWDVAFLTAYVANGYVKVTRLIVD